MWIRKEAHSGGGGIQSSPGHLQCGFADAVQGTSDVLEGDKTDCILKHCWFHVWNGSHVGMDLPCLVFPRLSGYGT